MEHKENGNFRTRQRSLRRKMMRKKEVEELNVKERKDCSDATVESCLTPWLCLSSDEVVWVCIPCNTGLFIRPSRISGPCGTVAGMVTPKGSMSTALQRVSEEFDYRIDICRVTKGEHIEHL
jgi:hypothetical protein